MPSPVIIYTDGACKGNPGPGGWAAVLSHNGKERTLCGGELSTTNNRMEMTAVLRAIQCIKKANCRLKIFTDSQYVQRGMQEWLPTWRKNKFHKRDGKPVLNADLWRQLDAVAAVHAIEWCWVRGHDGNPGNEQADALAQQQAEHYRQQQ